MKVYGRFLNPSRRSENMRRIKAKDTKPEMVVRRLLHSLGYRYRLHAKDLPGKPDIVFRKRKKAIFVHGCFCISIQNAVRGDFLAPDLNTGFLKLTRNMARDREQPGGT